MLKLSDKITIIKLRRQIRDERKSHVAILEKLKEIKNHDEWVSQTNTSIAKINTAIRESNRWIESGDKFGIKLSKNSKEMLKLL